MVELTAKAVNLISTSFGSSSSVRGALTQAAKDSPYLAGLLNAYADKATAKIDLRPDTPGGGQANADGSITIGSGMRPADAGGSNSISDFIVGLAHELGHAVLAHGFDNGNNADKPEVAVQIGLRNEGVAPTAELQRVCPGAARGATCAIFSYPCRL